VGRVRRKGGKRGRNLQTIKKSQEIFSSHYMQKVFILHVDSSLPFFVVGGREREREDNNNNNNN
jgi:hypothetical protein